MFHDELRQLTSAALQHLSEEYALSDKIVVDTDSYGYFKQFAQSLQKTKGKPLQATPPQLERPKILPAALPTKKPPPPKQQIQTEPPKQKPAEQPRTERVPKEAAAPAFATQPLPPPPVQDFSTFRSILGKNYPSQVIIDEHASSPTQSLRRIVILADKHPVFVNLAKALRTHYPTFTVDVSEISENATLILGEKERLARLQPCNCPILPLESGDSYANNPSLKRNLWNDIEKAIIKSEIF